MTTRSRRRGLVDIASAAGAIISLWCEADIEMGVLSDILAERRYVGFVDILGFRAEVARDFDGARRALDQMAEELNLYSPRDSRPNMVPMFVDITLASDSFVVVAETGPEHGTSPLQNAVNWCSSVIVAAARVGWMVRGSVAYGMHAETKTFGPGRSRTHALVVSEALSDAVTDEQSAARKSSHPSGITLGGTVPEEAISELDQRGGTNYQRSILFYRDRWVANPFGAGAQLWLPDRIRELASHPRNAAHAQKYDYLLDLWSFVQAGASLRP